MPQYEPARPLRRWPIADNIRKAEIVIVEDNAADVLLIQKALDANGVAYVMTRFEDGDAALDALCPENGKPNLGPDIIVLDLNLPRTDGIEVLRQIRQAPQLAGVPVAILTSSESPGDKRETTQLGADRYILKPSQLEEFFSRVGSEIRELLLERDRRTMGGSQ